MIDNNLPMTPVPSEMVYVYDQNFNMLSASNELWNIEYEDEIITRSKGKEILTFYSADTSSIYQYLQIENIIQFGRRWFRIKFLEDEKDSKGVTKFTCYALWYELAEGLPKPIKMVATNVGAVADAIVKDYGKWAKLVIPAEARVKPVRSITLKENSGLYKLRYLAKQYNLELTFSYEEVIEQELRYVKTVVFIQPYTESKIEFPLVVEENMKYIVREEDSRQLCTAYKLTGKKNDDSDEELTFASINNGSDYLLDVSWFTARQMRPRYIAKSKQDDRFKIKENMLDAARAYLDVYAKPLLTYEASAVLYEKIPDLHHSQLIVDDQYKVIEWRKISSRKLNYSDLTNSTIVFDDPRRDLMDLINDDGDGAITADSGEQSHVVIRYANDILGTGFNADSGKYIGVLTTTKKTEDLTPDDFKWVPLEGPTGPQGKPGIPGTPGRDGVDGVAGKNGVGIADTAITYAISTSGTTAPTTGWSEQVPTLVKGQYLWTKTFWRYTDGEHETGYSVTYIGQDGNSGRDGIAGKDGVGIASTEVKYAKSNSGLVPPSGQVLLDYTGVLRPSQSRNDNIIYTELYFNATNGAKYKLYGKSSNGQFSGTHSSADASSRVVIWGVSTDGANVHRIISNNTTGTTGNEFTWTGPTGRTRIRVNTYNPNNTIQVEYLRIESIDESIWSSQVPQVPDGQYLWTRTTWTYTDRTKETGYSVARMGLPGPKGDKGNDGVAGKNGVGLKRTEVTYGLSNSDSVQPAQWASQVPTLVKGQYLWTKTTWTYSDNTSETGYQKTYIARDGNNGTNGLPGKDGVGIRSTTITYAGSTSGTVAPTTNWTSSIPNVQPGFFLWTKTVWNYTDGTSETGYAVSKMGETGPRGLTGLQGETGKQGIPGTPGRDGRSQFTHIAFSDSPDGTGFNHTDQGRAYIGLYQDYTEVHSKDKAAYRWSKWKGADGSQGIPGKPGTDGKTSYFHIAYSSSANGSRNFSLQDKNQQYMGYYSDQTIADSSDPKKYRWFDRMANVQVGGKNEFLNSLFSFDLNEQYSTYRFNQSDVAAQGQLVATIDSQTKFRNYNTLKIVSTWNGEFNNQKLEFVLGGDDRLGTADEWSGLEARISFWAKSTKPAKLQARPGYRGSILTADITTEWKYFNFKFMDALSSNCSSDCILHIWTPDVTVWLVMIQVELGTVTTQHKEAEEDIAYRLSKKADGKLTQDQLNALAEKAQLHEAQLQAKATMEQLSDLEKAYNARVQANEEAIKASEAALIDAGRRIEATVQELGGLRELKKFIDTYMSASNEGLIIGKNDASSTIKVSPDRISMFSAGKEVMYISQGVINIDNGVFTRSLQIGRFITEQHYADKDLNVCRYVG